MSGRTVGAPAGVVPDSIGWDVATWSRALPFWQARSRLASRGRALEVGAGGDNAGLSLWLASQGFEVTCTGLEPPSRALRETHQRYGVADRVTYATADVLDLPYDGCFDLVAFKSVLGRVGGGDRFDRQQAAVAQLHAALRPGGELWFSENLAASRLHQLGRRRFGAGRWQWRYLDLDEVEVLLRPFREHELTTFGLTAALGRTERQRRALARVDRAGLERAAPHSWHYVVAGVARA